MAGPHLHLLGGFDFVGSELAAPVLSRKASAMMAFLAMQTGHRQSREKLATLLWGMASESQARMSLRQVLSSLRKAFQSSSDEWFLADGANIALRLDDFDFDVPRFEALVKGSSIDNLEEAVAVYRGDLLEGFVLREEPFEDWLRLERERLRTMAVAALERLVFHYVASGELTSCVCAGARLLGMEPLREDIHRALMRAYSAQGRINLALKQYELCRKALTRDLALPPEPETRQLYETLRARRTKSVRPQSPLGKWSEAQPECVSFDVEISRPQTHYVKSAGVNIAYQVTGNGTVDIVHVPGWVSNLDLAWASPRYAHVLERLGRFSRLIRLDKRGTGLSDRNVGLPTLEQRMEDVRAVLDEVGSKRAVLFGTSEGGPMCMLFAATYPERTTALVLNGTYATGRFSTEYPWGKTAEQMEEDIAAVERQWGQPADLTNAAPSLMNDAVEREWFAAYLRSSASPADAIALWRWGVEIDVRDILSAIHVPTLIMQRTGDRWVRAEEGRYLAERIGGARYLELDGRDHLIWGEDCDRLVDEVEAFVAGNLPPASGKQVLVSVLSLAIEGATENPVEQYMDKMLNQLLLAEGRRIHRLDGALLAVFQRPTRSIECAIAIRRQLKQFGLDVRSAVHIGECEQRGDEFTGNAVAMSFRLLGHARPGEIIASRTMRDLVAGSGLTFEMRGELNAREIQARSSFLP